MKQGERKNFASKLGLILATAGSAVGLGNIWRFPVEAGEGGGGAFLLLYIICIVIIGVPLMTAEFLIGRAAHSNTSSAYRSLTTNPFFKHFGILTILIGWFIMCYYIVVSGWTLQYLLDSISGTFIHLDKTGNANAYADHFNALVSNPWKPIVCLVIFVLMSHYIISRGVEKGIERFSKIMMPLLFVILLILALCSLFTDGAREGLSFLFKPDFSKITFSTALQAMGQAFFSLSIGVGCLCTYASYFSSTTDLQSTALKVSVIDSLVAIIAGVVIFPAVFAVGMSPDAGPSLVFVALPNVFHLAFVDYPWSGYIVSSLFYALLVLATLTSVISLHEVPTAWLSEGFNLSRRMASGIVTVICIIIGGFCSLSMGVLRDWKVGSMNIFEFFDWSSSNVLLPLSGFLLTLFVGWVMPKSIVYEQLANKQGKIVTAVKILVFILRYVAPVAIFLILMRGLGMI
ncbi:MAG: sodium-dependent transporter [Alloprevotella sp.]|nr:sodium-dependent transporter [Alloprevotella sp.]